MTIATFVFILSLMLILNISSYNTLTIKIPYVSAIQGQNLTSVPEHLVNATLALAVQGKITLTDNNTAIRFNPISPLNRNTRYTITITKGLMDISGASMSADKEWHFTTLA